MVDFSVDLIANISSAAYHGRIDIDSFQPARFWEWLGVERWGNDALGILTIVGIFFSILFLGVLVFVGNRRRSLQQGADAPADEMRAAEVTAPAGQRGMLYGRWDTIRTRLDSPREADWKVALLEADALIDDALARAGFSGDTFGDRLTNMAPGALASLDGIWWAHKVRNRVAHEQDYFLRYTEARQAFGYYEAALTELRLI